MSFGWLTIHPIIAVLIHSIPSMFIHLVFTGIPFGFFTALMLLTCDILSYIFFWGGERVVPLQSANLLDRSSVRNRSDNPELQGYQYRETVFSSP